MFELVWLSSIDGCSQAIYGNGRHDNYGGGEKVSGRKVRKIGICGLRAGSLAEVTILTLEVADPYQVILVYMMTTNIIENGRWHLDRWPA